MEINKCRCCFPFQCGEIQLKMSGWEFEKLKMALKYSTILRKNSFVLNSEQENEQ